MSVVMVSVLWQVMVSVLWQIVSGFLSALHELQAKP